ncbi:subtilase family protein [Sphingomonas sp. BK036]|uniref:S8 family peptidase n=1 Tax=Sphingomonas sp. BK036 TaxID=2512122 RepID=UPI001029D64F|nr:S8 family peptidase [Sphingomonas sp. BK036]RZT56636.1 subtilase family protein [Sphingomonas sp. BK036]
MRRFKAGLLRSAPIATGLLLAGCGGGGGGGINSTPTPPAATIPAPTPTPTPTPAPTPAPTPTPSSYDTTEYRATVGAVSMNALAAYRVGATGKGIGVGVIDSGIDLQSQEFGTRVASTSQDVAGNSSIDDEGGHGTAVAFTLAGRRNDAGTHGVAFDSTLIVLRADRPGTCATASKDDEDSGCKFSTDAITRGLDAARTAGAKVVNISLGGSDMPQSLKDAVGRATAAGLVVVIAAGNDGSTNPDPFTTVASEAQGRNQVIIAGSVGAGDGISSFSDRAGSGAAHFLTAVGESVRAPDETDTAALWSGTSFAAPQISGAVALLAQAFPNITGAQIVDILFKSARDAGAPGVDSVYGNGVLDLTRAFQPLGTTSVAGSKAVVSTTSNAVLSAPMGDATQGELGAVILDGYSRAFAIDLAKTIARRSPDRSLGSALQSRLRNVALAQGGMTVSMTLAPRGNGDVALDRTTLSTADATSARAIAGMVTQRLGSTLSFGFGFAQGSGTLSAQLSGQSEPAFLIASTGNMRFDSTTRASSAIRQSVGGFGFTAGLETGDVLTQRDSTLQLRDRWQRSGYTRASLAVDRRFGALATMISAMRMDERDTVLGARFDAALGATRAATWFVDTKARFDAGAGWSLGGSMRQGWTHAAVRGGLDGDGLVRTTAFAADIGKDGVFGHDSLGLRIAQPLRVARGGVDLRLPTYFDYTSGAVTDWTTQRLNLAPQGRELDVELRYGLPAFGGGLDTNLFWRRDPGNVAALPNDYGMAMRYSLGF